MPVNLIFRHNLIGAPTEAHAGDNPRSARGQEAAEKARDQLPLLPSHSQTARSAVGASELSHREPAGRRWRT